MANYSRKSRERLETCDPRLQKVFNEVVKTYDNSILEGIRTPERQQMLFDTGKSETLNSKHIPRSDGYSKALDVAPYPIDFENKAKKLARFYHFAGYVLRVAEEMGIKIRFGGDWDSDKDFEDQNFDDLVHFELIED